MIGSKVTGTAALDLAEATGVQLRNYQTNQLLEGPVSEGLIAASLAAGPEGAVRATCLSAGPGTGPAVWTHNPEHGLTTVYVERVSAPADADLHADACTDSECTDSCPVQAERDAEYAAGHEWHS